MQLTGEKRNAGEDRKIAGKEEIVGYKWQNLNQLKRKGMIRRKLVVSSQCSMSGLKIIKSDINEYSLNQNLIQGTVSPISPRIPVSILVSVFDTYTVFGDL